MVHHASFIVYPLVTAKRKPAHKPDPITAPGWLAIVLLVALACVIGSVLF
jgi:hypothetical protein